MPLIRRVPKRGFTNIFRVEYAVVNLARLAKVEAAEVDPESLVTLGMVKKGLPVKVLGTGEIGKALKVVAHKFSASARAKIEAAGGSCEELGS
jgi:large subunit ribosomal protein L15